MKIKISHNELTRHAENIQEYVDEFIKLKYFRYSVNVYV